MTISSVAAADLAAVCRDGLGRDLVRFERIGAGRNSRVFRVELDGADTPPPFRVVVKFYRSDPGDTRDRLRTEFASLQFLWENGVRVVPRPMVMDRDRRCAIYEYIAGEVATSFAPGPADVDASVDFLGVLKRLHDAPGSEALPPASEACFSLDDVMTSVEQRLERLRDVPDDGNDAIRLLRWIEDTFEPLMTQIREWCQGAARQSHIAFDEQIDQKARTLSPSDFGLHNAIRRPDRALAFVDFEYFGWDDPAKTVVDYLLHPGMTLGDTLKRRFAARAQTVFADTPAIGARARIAYPLFGLKWALILLNDFLPERFSTANSARRSTQLEKAQAIVGRLASDYFDNPYLP